VEASHISCATKVIYLHLNVTTFGGSLNSVFEAEDYFVALSGVKRKPSIKV